MDIPAVHPYASSSVHQPGWPIECIQRLVPEWYTHECVYTHEFHGQWMASCQASFSPWSVGVNCREQAHMIRHQLAVLKISFIITPRPRKLPPFFSDDIFKYIFFYIFIQFSLRFSQASSWQWVRVDSDKGLKFERSSWQRVGIGSDDSLARKAMCTTWTNDDLSKHTDVHVYMHHSTQLNTVHVPVYHLNDIIATASPSPERLKLSHWQPLELLQ